MEHTPITIRGSRTLALLGTLVSLVWISGCGIQYDVDINALADPSAKLAKTYVLRPGNPDTTVSSLQYKEYVTYLERALATDGFKKAPSLDEAEIVIFLGYGISEAVTRSSLQMHKRTKQPQVRQKPRQYERTIFLPEHHGVHS
jgi:hypothetical protein